MATKKVTYVIDVKGNAEKKLEDLTKDYQDLGKAAEKTNDELANTGKAASKVNKNLTDTGKAAKKASDGIEDVTKNGGAIAVLDSVTGGLATKFRDAFEATKLFNFSLKGTRTALIATGIGALVVALGLVVAYWDDIVGYITGANKQLEIQLDLIETQQGLLEGDAKILEAREKLLISEGKSVTQVRKERVTLAKLQIESLKTQIETLGTQLEKEKSVGREFSLWQKIWFGTQQAAGIDTSHQIAAAIAEQAAREAEISSKLDAAKVQAINLETFINEIEADPDGNKTETDAAAKKTTDSAKKVADAKKKANDATLKAEDDELKKLEALRISYIEKERDLAAETALEKNALAEKRALEELEKLGGTEQDKLDIKRYYFGLEIKIIKENAIKKAQAEQEVTDLINQGKLDKLERNVSNADNPVDALENEKLVIQEKLRQEDEAHLAELDRLTEANESTEAEMQRHENIKVGLNADLVENEQDTAAAVTEAKYQLVEDSINALGNLGAALQAAAGENKKIAAAGLVIEGIASLASIGVNTAKGIAYALGTYAPPLSYAMAAVTAAAGIAQAVASVKATKKGLDALGESSGGGSLSPGGISPPSGGAVSAPNYSIIGDVQATSGGQVGTTEAIQEQNDTPVKAYVVSTDVTTAQALDRQIDDNSRI